MTSSTSPLDDFLNTVLGDPILDDDLSETDKAMVKALLGELAIAISPAPPTMTPQPAKAAQSTCGQPDPELEQPDMSADMLLNTLLQEQSESALVGWLQSHLESAFRILEVLSNRSIGRQELELLRRVELQLITTTLGVADLRAAVESSYGSGQYPRPAGWYARIRRLLLQEFNGINNLLR